MNAAERLLSAGAEGAVALECGEAATTVRRTARSLFARAGADVAGSLGLERGERVIVGFAPDSIDWVVSLSGRDLGGRESRSGSSRGSGRPISVRSSATARARYVWCEADAAPGICDPSPRTIRTGPRSSRAAPWKAGDWTAALAAGAAPDGQRCSAPTKTPRCGSAPRARPVCRRALSTRSVWPPLRRASPHRCSRRHVCRSLLRDVEALLRVRAREQPVRGAAPRRHRRTRSRAAHARARARAGRAASTDVALQRSHALSRAAARRRVAPSR